jgi:hypothetical protein
VRQRVEVVDLPEQLEVVLHLIDHLPGNSSRLPTSITLSQDHENES